MINEMGRVRDDQYGLVKMLGFSRPIPSYMTVAVKTRGPRYREPRTRSPPRTSRVYIGRHCAWRRIDSYEVSPQNVKSPIKVSEASSAGPSWADVKRSTLVRG